jgi:imidazole glycerol-phosphate synthase subunit HisH
MSTLIIDHGLCNIDSITRALIECGADVNVSNRPEDIAAAERLVLPGVGSFAAGMRNLNETGVSAALRQALAERPRPMLGICLGMQLMADFGTEGGGVPGLGILSGRVELLQPSGNERLPHIGWNRVDQRGSSPLFEGIADGADFYFVHSFAFLAGTRGTVGVTPYAGGFAAAVSNGLVHGVQFHPEKSQRIGFQLLRNFLAL